MAGQALRRDPPGLIYVDEYVGPSRNEWTEERLGYAAGLFELIPAGCRRTPHVLPPIVLADPTEMIRSSEIERLLREKLQVISWHPYYGNVLTPLISSIRASRLHEPRVRWIIEEAMRLEDYLVSRGLLHPLYAQSVLAAHRRAWEGEAASQPSLAVGRWDARACV